ncbi:MAG: Arylsulfatase [candidate division BRC1 bacterium ADurb.BinA364]|nr:MAG: Arylsulfatase [candidate division BRC1 bacterium ADurb.BinA364]
MQKIYGNQWAGADYWVHPELRGGFEDWFGFNLSNNYYSTFYSRGEQVEPFKVEGYQTDGLFDLSIDCLSGHDSSRPWFHVLSFEAPHGGQGRPPRFPGHPAPPRYEAMFEPERIALRGNVPAQTEAQARKQLCGYYAMIANIDDNVGRLLDWLDSSGQADNTLVVFFADHGDMMGSHGRFNKQVPHEESIRIPLIMRMPGVIRPGATVGALASGIDIYPTCAGLCGVPAAADVQGMDLAGLLDGTGAAERTDVFIQWIGKTRFEFGDHPYRAIRSRRYTFSVGRDEQFNLLFDNEADPYQMNNLFGDPGTAEVKRQLLLRLKRATLRAGEPAPDFLERALAQPR